MNPEEIKIQDYNYKLPEEKIAKFPLKSRDESKMLISWGNKIEQGTIKDFPAWLSKIKNYHIILNDTKVINARLIFTRGIDVQPFEIFYLNPVVGSVEEAMSSKKSIETWCKVRNSKKWKDNINLVNHQLTAQKIERVNDKFKILFTWNNNFTWSEILEKHGQLPLPPYMKRQVDNSDSDRYQTVFAKKEGSVAAPTAGLHLTSKILDEISTNGGDINYLQLHIGAGTFQPVSENYLGKHIMHSEEVSISIKTINNLMDDFDNIAIGTTAARALESLYWIALELFNNNTKLNHVNQWAPYKKYKSYLSRSEALSLIKEYAISRGDKEIKFNTSLLIVPGYKFRLTDVLMTNFHQPKSTLLLLIAAAVGDRWKEIYNYALSMDFRFLSYGDACLLKIRN